MTLIIGNPGETDEDVKDTIDLIYEVERRSPVRVLHPVDLHAAPRHAHGVEEGRVRDARARRSNGS
jgi:radical SAM superfamily enzyme YgiQ (UPF0313 family)